MSVLSLAKPWLRPIVRGKETKKVEFGFKAHILQAGICIIDYLAANAFNESTVLNKVFISIRKSSDVLLILELMEFTQRIKIAALLRRKI